jgi:hypothetical protein
MNKDIKKLLAWYDKKTNYYLSATNLASEISLLKTVPPSMVAGLAAFKKRNRLDRLRLARKQVHYAAEKLFGE